HDCVWPAFSGINGSVPACYKSTGEGYVMFAKLIRGTTSLLAAGALMLNVAYVAAQPAPNGPPPGGFPGGFPGGTPGGPPGLPRMPQQTQGFENMRQDPAKYTAAQKAAADVALKWIDFTDTKNLAGQMAMVDNEIVYRGGPSDALVLIKRADMNFGAATDILGLGGDPVAVATFARVRNGKLVEWLDAP